VTSAAITYAHSLFALAEEENIEQAVFEELTELEAIIAENPDYVILLDSPTVKVSERCNLIDEAFSGCSEYVKNFLKILCEKKYIHIFPECVKEYEKQYNKKYGKLKVTAITAVPLSNELKEKLLTKLKKDTGKTITLELRVDKSILGGIILRTENSQTDASVRARLDSIRTQLSSHQID